MRIHSKSRFIATSILLCCVNAQAYTDGTVLVLDAGATTLTLTNSGSQAGSYTHRFPDPGTGKVKVWLSAVGYPELGSETACANPCTQSINMERGQYILRYKMLNSGGSTLYTSSKLTIPLIQAPALTAPFTVPFAVHGFQGFRKSLQFNPGSGTTSNLRLWLWIFNPRQGETAVKINSGSEKLIATTQIGQFSTNGSGTCTAITNVPHGLSSGSVQLSGFKDYLQNASDKALNGTQTATVVNATTFTVPCSLAKLDDAGSGDWNQNPETGQPMLGRENGKTVSQTVWYANERGMWFGGLDGVPEDFELTMPIGDSEITASANNTITFINKGGQQLGHHGPWIKDINVIEPDCEITALTVSSATATATCNAHGYLVGETILLRAVSGPRWAFNGKRVITAKTTNTFSFLWGPDKPGTTPGVAPYTLSNGTYPVTATSGDTIVAPQPHAYAARCKIAEADFAYYDPLTQTTYGGIAATGETLFKTAALKDLNDYFPNHASLATCSDCHMFSGYDLKYFGWNQDTIIEASIRRGLSEQNGKDIAAYISSLSVTTPANGRPWAKMWQPCPGTSTSAIGIWAAGCGDEWDLSYDQDTRPYVCTGGSPPDYAGCSYAAWAPDVGGINTRDVPVVTPFWHWMRFLPAVHPKDFFSYYLGGLDFTAQTINTLYQSYLTDITNFATFKTKNYMFFPSNGLYTPLQTLANLYNTNVVGGGTRAAGYFWPSPYLPAVNSLISSWPMSRIIEIHLVAGLQNVYDQVYNDLYGTQNARAAAQTSRGMGSLAYMFAGAPHKCMGGGQPAWLNTTRRTILNHSRDTHILYQMAGVTDMGNRRAVGNTQQDWPYSYGFITDMCQQRPSAYLHILPVAYEIANSNGWDGLNNSGNDQPQTSTNPRFPMVWKHCDAFITEAEKAELVDQTIKQMVYVAATWNTAQWQAFITAGEGAIGLTHVASLTNIDTSIYRSDGVAYALALSNYFGLSSSDRTAIKDWANLVFVASGHDFATDINSTCTYSGHPKQLACVRN